MSSLSPAAALVPIRPDGRVLAGVRSDQARSLQGYFAFPGGGAEAEDARLPLASAAGGERVERACALRELGEETGHWLLCDALQRVPTPEAGARFVSYIEAGSPLEEALARTRLQLDDRALVPLGRWRMRRFDLRQFLLPCRPERMVQSAAGPELLQVQWHDLHEVSDAWGRGDALLIPPVRFLVDGLRGRTLTPEAWGAALPALRAVPDPAALGLAEILRGVAVQALRSDTLPPATTTNAVLLGAGDYWIVDPATPDEGEQRRFDALIEALAAAGRRPLGIALTHHHPDHVADVERLRRSWQLAVWAHEATAARVPFAVDHLLREGDELFCPGEPERRFAVLHTPGHAAGHLCFFDAATGTLIAGDMVAAEGSILIDPDEGHMATYLASLERLLTLPVRRVVAAHGPLLAEGREKLAEQLAHRRAREAQVSDVLRAAQGPMSVERLVERVYGAHTPAAMLPYAARSLLAILHLLRERGEAQVEAEGYAWVADDQTRGFGRKGWPSSQT